MNKCLFSIPSSFMIEFSNGNSKNSDQNSNINNLYFQKSDDGTINILTQTESKDSIKNILNKLVDECNVINNMKSETSTFYMNIYKDETSDTFTFPRNGSLFVSYNAAISAIENEIIIFKRSQNRTLKYIKTVSFDIEI